MKPKFNPKEARKIRRNPSISAIRFYIIATLFTLVLFLAWRSWGTGILLAITMFTLAGHILNVIHGQRKPVQNSSVKKMKKTETTTDLKAVYDNETDLWNLAFGEQVSLMVGGSSKEPNSLLVESASWFRENAQQFQAEIDKFLRLELNRFRKWPDAVREIKSLRIETIQLPWPKRPNDGMIYFVGNDSDRVWRCDMVQRHPKNLGFDD